MFEEIVAIRGGGDLGSGVALRLWRSGFRVAVLEIDEPIAVRRTVSFSEAIYDRVAKVEEATGHRVAKTEMARAWDRQEVPVVVDPGASCLSALKPYCVVDAILAKRNTGTRIDMATLVIGLGPGFVAGGSVHAVVETNRGPDLGRVIWCGTSEPNTGEPARVRGGGLERVLRAPAAGTLRLSCEIGEIVDEGDVLANIGAESIKAGFRSLVRGLARDGLYVQKGMKVGDIDPRLDPSLCTRVSDKSLAIAGGVVEALLATINGRRS
jgi:xanthine dehydrogenase accessory factor